MRGLTKVAALLSSTWAAAFVIPPSQPSGGVIAYNPSNASVKFAIADLSLTSRQPTFEFSVSSIDKPCGETNVRLNGQSLASKWADREAYGRGFLDVYGEREAVWSITCLYDSISSPGIYTSESNGVHLLRLSFVQEAAGFTISYHQAGEASIIRFSPHVIDDDETIRMGHVWRQPSVEFDEDLLMNHKFNGQFSALSKSLWHGSQNFLSSISAFQSQLKAKFLSLTGCHRQKAHVPTARPSPLALAPLTPLGNETRSTPEISENLEASNALKIDEIHAVPEQDADKFGNSKDIQSEGQISSPTSQALDSTSTLPYISAAETRSLHNPEEPADTLSTTGPSPATSTPHDDLNYRAIKIFGLTLIILSLLAWCLLRWKDPRWRAERAARCEEQRTKRLYKIAARKHKMKVFLGNVRARFLKLRFTKALGWDEKQTEISSNDESSTNVVAVGNLHESLSYTVSRNLAAAEEGRFQFDYDAESSQRRRSVSTLPGYESDGGQLPPYEERRNFETPTQANGMTFVPIDVDSNPDSSVISTSPRFSRDGTNSDFDEKIEILSLDQNFRFDNCP